VSESCVTRSNLDSLSSSEREVNRRLRSCKSTDQIKLDVRIQSLFVFTKKWKAETLRDLIQILTFLNPGLKQYLQLRLLDERFDFFYLERGSGFSQRGSQDLVSDGTNIWLLNSSTLFSVFTSIVYVDTWIKFGRVWFWRTEHQMMKIRTVVLLITALLKHAYVTFTCFLTPSLT
jgi:hypothetical protein